MMYGIRAFPIASWMPHGEYMLRQYIDTILKKWLFADGTPTTSHMADAINEEEPTDRNATLSGDANRPKFNANLTKRRCRYHISALISEERIATWRI